MFFQVDNTPEIVRKKRRVDESKKAPRLTLAPFASVPVITFEDIPVKSRAVRYLEVHNPLSASSQVSIVKPPPADLDLELSWTEANVEPENYIMLELSWLPKGAAAQRFTMQLADHRKGKFDVIIVCKTAVEKKTNLTKKKSVTSMSLGVKKSPKVVKTKRLSPKGKFYVPLRERNMQANIWTESTLIQDVSIKYQRSSVKSLETPIISSKLPNPQSEDLKDIRRETYLVSDQDDKENNRTFSPELQLFSQRHKLFSKNVSPTAMFSAIDSFCYTPQKKQPQCNFSDVTVNTPQLKSKTPIRNIDALIDGLELTPLRNHNYKQQKYDDCEKDETVTLGTTSFLDKHEFITKNTNYILKDNSNLNVYKKENKGYQSIPDINLTHPIIDLCDISTLPKVEEMPESWNHNPKILIDEVERQPGSLNFYNINTGSFSNVGTTGEVFHFTPTNKNMSDLDDSVHNFNPKRCSTERKSCDHLSFSENKNSFCGDLLQSYSPRECLNVTYENLSSGTYTKGDSPIVPLEPNNQSSPYSICGMSPNNPVPVPPNVFPRKLPFSENMKGFNERADLRNSIKEKNTKSSAKDIIEANLWQRTPPRPTSPTLAPIPEELTFCSEISIQEGNRKAHCDTFVINKTFEIPKPISKPPDNEKRWSKSGTNWETKKVTSVQKTFSKQVAETCKFSLNASEVEMDTDYNYTNIKSVATTIDPFLASTCLYDERAYDELENEFKTWLNYLLTPPADLDTNLDNSKMDIGKAWIESRNKSVPAAPTKEQVSAKYHTSHRLESLRKSAKLFSKNPNIVLVFTKVVTEVEKKNLTIRTDKNIHLDIGLQKIILNLLLCYNPLWLRIGLETIYDKKIPMTSNDDFMGLSAFVIEKMFKDPYISAKHSQQRLPNVHCRQYTENVKKFTLKKFLFLVYFLDQAKQSKVIPHDPCLFCRNALFKESREILFQFTKEVLSGVGDITKHLSRLGYTVSHKQIYLHEFKYAVHNLALDLKDGVRLTRLMEIILMRENLTSGLRTPAISRLQKIYNVKIALSALESAGFNIIGDITAKDIADGHREKTLSLLWQLINKFRAPLFCNAALVIQKWWRRKYIGVWLKKRIEIRKKQKFIQAATTIQRWWKTILCRRQHLALLKKKPYVCMLQQRYRAKLEMRKCREMYLVQRKSSILIQRYFRSYLQMKRIQNSYLEKRNAIITIQKYYRYHVKTTQTREYYLSLKTSCVIIQKAFRNIKIMKNERERFVQLRQAAIVIQTRYRALCKMKLERNEYLKIFKATLAIQRVFRAKKEMQRYRNYFIIQCSAARIIQSWYRSIIITRQARSKYLHIKECIVTIQRMYRSTVEMRRCRREFINLKKASVVIQSRFRANILMRNSLNEYTRLKQAATVIQRIFRARSQMVLDHQRYIKLKISVIKIQNVFRSYLFMKSVRTEYLTLKRTVSMVQNRYRAKLAMRECLEQYQKQKSSALLIQKYVRSHKAMKMEREYFLKLKEATVKIQSYFKAKLARKAFLEKKSAVIKLQSVFRMLKARKEYLALKNSAIIVQSHFKAQKVRKQYLTIRITVVKVQSFIRMWIVRKKYIVIRKSVLLIQRTYRNKLQIEAHKQESLNRNFASTKIQTCWRRYIAQKKYNRLVSAVIVCQTKRRAQMLMRKQREAYLLLKMEREEFDRRQKAAIVVQNRYRALCMMRSIREEYLRMYNAVIVLQRMLRARRCMQICRHQFLSQRSAAISIQHWYRSILSMRQTHSQYTSLRTSVITIQRMYREKLIVRKCRQEYTTLRSACIVIQTRYRAKILMMKCLTEFNIRKQAVIAIQRRFRAYSQMESDRGRYLILRSSVLKIQNTFRSFLLMKTIRTEYLNLKRIACFMQSKYRAKLAMRKYLYQYQKQKSSAVAIQRYFRTYRIMKAQREQYLRLRQAAITIQSKIRGTIARRAYLEKKSASIRIQSIYRMYRARQDYLKLQTATIVLQRHFRNILLTRQVMKQYVTIKMRIVKIQSIVRMWIARRTYLTIRNSVLLIQRAFRNKLQIEAQKRMLAIQISAVTKIQSQWRGYVARSGYNALRKAVVTCQSRRRAIIEMRRERAAYTLLRLSTVKIQAAVYGWLTRRTISKLKTERAEARKLAERNDAAIVIQKHWRGYEVRKVQATHCKVAALRRRWKEGALQSDQLTLAQRSQDAMEVLCHFRDVASVIRAFKTLDYVTNVYPMMYGSEEGAVPLITRLVLYMGATNRSVSTLETLQLGAAILVNLTKFTPTAHYVYKVDHLRTVLTLILSDPPEI